MGFGTFELRARAARKGRNPQTGEEMDIKASNIPAFSASKAFRAVPLPHRIKEKLPEYTELSNGSRPAAVAATGAEFQTTTNDKNSTPFRSARPTGNNTPSSSSEQPPPLLNGTKGAETHTVGEAGRIRLTKLLMDLREDDGQEQLELPPTLTNTERKFVHELAGRLGLVSKSRGKLERRYIRVSKRKQGNKTTGTTGTTGADNEEELQIPVLSIGPKGSQALKEHLQQYPPTHSEELESRETGASLVEALTQRDDGGDTDAAVVRTLQQLGLGSGQEAPQVAKRSRPVNLERRKRYHAAAQQQKQFSNPKEYHNMQQLRIKLPAWSHEAEIVQIVAQNAVTIISGETGCGKSTQIPQFLLDASPGAKIVVTQPRRISAISIAERVAQEQCQPVGGLIGYQVRLESAACPDTQLLFLTPGVLLRKLHSSPTLAEYTHIIIDEIHERDKYTEFLLIALRDLLPRRPDLRVILMSATLQTESLVKYFDNPAQVEMEGRTFEVQEYFLETVLEMTRNGKNAVLGQFDYNSGGNEKNEGEGAVNKKWDGKSPFVIVNETPDSLSLKHEELLDLYQTTHDDEQIDTFLLMKVLQYIVKSSHEDGAILIFFPGWHEISEFSLRLEGTMPFLDRSKYLVLPLHSGIPSRDQRKVLQRAPQGVRKIILSTNIAETSLTIDDVAFVVDTGRAKEKSYDPHLKTSTLQPVWISQASSKQRRGRAGRTKTGVCFHLFSSRRHSFMPEFTESELLRTPLVSKRGSCCAKMWRQFCHVGWLTNLSASLGGNVSDEQKTTAGSWRIRGQRWDSSFLSKGNEHSPPQISCKCVGVAS
jgi:HrpA-like RNA helicase